MRGVHTDKVIIDEVQDFIEQEDDKRPEEMHEVCIANMTTDEVETMWADPTKRFTALAQILGGVLASLHPLRNGELTVTDDEIRKGLTSQITIDRYTQEGDTEGFFHVKLKD